MKTAIIAFLLTGLSVAATGRAAAAELIDAAPATPQRGAFAGARLRVPFGGHEPARAGLALASVERTRETGATALATGLELGFTGRGRLALAAGGRTLRLDDKRKAGVSTLGWVAIGAGVAIIAGGLLFLDAVRDSSD
ncbi:hypothetical protein [Allosphingosinicella deserti]|uniref:Uncharacterized protein n=1 Tax=Allosphingosinicella deserti TaxID=2116704 RepID=A0A2P7QYL0_9SPHN|nr:hypothetical protein [Sphingomonas deserti]PSJ43033.1 hypothetical protein C7I55_01120 [Sphingomonas deserti]